ncbi:MAG: histidine--tRNA ligase [Candidatus Marisimplicoccus sp.]|jgi:histidyl-tRNA synthetase|tara:strand:- start:3620 stop:4996 length:1377 start_codon:yes stop_codon:yes gene_type:complete
MSQKLNTPKGTRDFSSLELKKRNYLLKVLRDSFKSFNFQEIQTPSFENLSTLTDKYGDEEDSLMFKILSSGEKVKKADINSLNDGKLSKFANSLSDKALRYDLTVPLSRFVQQNLNEITLPFKRFQTQLVWRADRPQKGRYREFLQCDVDIIGEKNFLNEVECIKVYDHVFENLGLPKLVLRINNREILEGISNIMNLESLSEISSTLDKSDKIGIDGVVDELSKKGIKTESIDKLIFFLDTKGSNKSKIDLVRKEFNSKNIPSHAIDSIEKIINTCNQFKLNNIEIEFDLSLARGLGYYTGTIVEVSSPKDFSLGSIGGGGRYDDLVQKNNPKLSGFGISFGFDRIFLILEELDLFPNLLDSSKSFLFLNFGTDKISNFINSVNQLRKDGIVCEIYPVDVKIKKQLDYANKKGIDFVVIIGDDELKKDIFKVKDMSKGEELIFTQIDSLAEKIKEIS